LERWIGCFETEKKRRDLDRREQRRPAKSAKKIWEVPISLWELVIQIKEFVLERTNMIKRNDKVVKNQATTKWGGPRLFQNQIK